MALRSGSFQILSWQLAHAPTTYAQLLQLPLPDPVTLNLTFSSPTSFRHKGNHLPLPLPENIFHSYLRRWNYFSGQAIDPDSFLEWVDGYVVILRHQIQSSKVAAGKHGSVTGFTGSVQFGLSTGANQHPEFIQAFLTLGNLAPYCGTGHKTTFGLGQTRLGWSADSIAPPPLQDQLADRIADLTTQFIAQRKRTGGDRATKTATTWATILARRELGESLQAIALDLEMPYETVKTYAKLARRAGRSV
jgi:CRISPR-associated endoribonuclease Cas6